MELQPQGKVEAELGLLPGLLALSKALPLTSLSSEDRASWKWPNPLFKWKCVIQLLSKLPYYWIDFY